MKLALVITSDRGQLHLNHTLPTLAEHLDLARFDTRVIVDDCGGEYIWAPRYQVVSHSSKKGLSGAVRTAWSYARSADYVAHFEEDWLLRARVPLDEIVATLERNPHLCQMVLKRCPVAGEGGAWIDDRYKEVSDLANATWLEHHVGFSLNPCVIPARTIRIGWPEGGGETEFNHLLPDEWAFGIWGSLDSDPMIEHLGIDRSVSWKL